MSYITVDDLINFAKKVPDEEDNSPQKYVDSAIEMVTKYLGYSPEEQNYKTVRRGDGGKLFELEAKPINEITKVLINETEINSNLFYFEKDSHRIKFLNGDVFQKSNLYTFTYLAGYKNKLVEEKEITTVPYIIQITTLQVADLLWESSGGNLAVNSTSFADTGTRVFNNFSADRFLKQIEQFKIVKMAV